MSRLGERMIRAAREAACYAAGETQDGFIRHDPPDVKAIRARLGLTQPAFAARFGLPDGSVRDWEQGRTAPDAAARVLLLVIAAEPEIVARAVQRG